MKDFKLNATICVSAYTTVTAETLEEAIEISKGRTGELGHIGSGYDEREDWIVPEIDGEPQDITEA